MFTGSFDYSCVEHKKGRREDLATPWEEGGQGCRCVSQFQELLLHDLVRAVFFMHRSGEQAFFISAGIDKSVPKFCKLCNADWALDLQNACIQYIMLLQFLFWSSIRQKWQWSLTQHWVWAYNIHSLNKSFGLLNYLMGALYNLCCQMRLNICCCFYMTEAKQCWFQWIMVSWIWIADASYFCIIFVRRSKFLTGNTSLLNS